MKFELPTYGRHLTEAEKQQEHREWMRGVSLCLIVLAAWVLIPDQAFAQSSGFNFQFSVTDQIMCGFLSYSKTKLAPVIAAIIIIISVMGHWLGATKVWGTLLYVSLGLGVIMGIGAAIAQLTSAGSSCLSS